MLATLSQICLVTKTFDASSLVRRVRENVAGSDVRKAAGTCRQPCARGYAAFAQPGLQMDYAPDAAEFFGAPGGCRYLLALLLQLPRVVHTGGRKGVRLFTNACVRRTLLYLLK